MMPSAWPISVPRSSFRSAHHALAMHLPCRREVIATDPYGLGQATVVGLDIQRIVANRFAQVETRQIAAAHTAMARADGMN